MKRSLQKMVVREGRRMFDSGSSHRLTASWDTNTYTADQIIYNQLEPIRARAREQSRNNDYATRLIQVLQNNVVGENGFKLRSQVVDFEGGADLLVRKLIETAWGEYSNAVELVELCDLIISSLITDGEVFIYHRLTDEGLLPQIIDPVLIDVSYNQESRNGPRIVMGIEYDALMRPVAYHVNDSYEGYHPGIGHTATASKPRTRIPATHITHLFKKLYVGQKRGLPWIAQSLGRLFQLGRYEEAALTAARIGAAKMGFFRSDANDEYTGDEESGDMQLNAEAGTFENIGGLEFQQFDPSYPAGEFDGFMTKTLKGISSGLGVDYHTLGNDLSGVNYSSARVGMLETREYYKKIQAWIIRKFIKPLFRQWLERELFMNTLRINDRPLNRGLFYYLPASFVGRRWDWVDPQKEANAKRIQYEMRITSLSQIIRERGDDPNEVFNEIAEETKLLNKLGINPAQVFEKMEAHDGEEDND